MTRRTIFNILFLKDIIAAKTQPVRRRRPGTIMVIYHHWLYLAPWPPAGPAGKTLPRGLVSTGIGQLPSPPIARNPPYGACPPALYLRALAAKAHGSVLPFELPGAAGAEGGTIAPFIGRATATVLARNLQHHDEGTGKGLATPHLCGFARPFLVPFPGTVCTVPSRLPPTDTYSP